MHHRQAQVRAILTDERLIPRGILVKLTRPGGLEADGIEQGDAAIQTLDNAWDASVRMLPAPRIDIADSLWGGKLERGGLCVIIFRQQVSIGLRQADRLIRHNHI